MRRSFVALSLFATSFALVACEDGPNQVFQPVSSNAANNFNNAADAGSASDDAHQGFGLDSGAGANKQDLCPGPVKAAVWKKMVTYPIIPPIGGAHIDMSGKAWAGLTVEQAEDPAQGGNCQSEVYYDPGDGETYNSWGDTQDVVFAYRTSNRKITYMAFQNGYVGTIEADSRDKAHHYSLGLPNSATGGRIILDNAPLTLDWSVDKATGQRTAIIPQLAPLVDALFATFAPALPAEPNCFANSHCKVATFSNDSAYMFIPAIGFAFRVQSWTASQPVPSTVVYFDQYLEKVLSFSYSAPLLKLDSEGPVAVSKGLGTGHDCKLRMTSAADDLTYKEFLADCVEVTNDPTANQTELNKLLGGVTHGNERFSFDVSGVDINFTDKTLDPKKIIGDQDLPTPDDEATTFSVDQSTLGQMANDYTNNDVTQPKDLHGAGLIYLEYARLVQEYLEQFRPAGAPLRTLGDPACLFPNLKFKTDGTVEGAVPAGCTGFEGFMTTAPQAAVTDPNMKLLAAKVDDPPTGAVAKTLALGLKPGSPTVMFCAAPRGDAGDPEQCASGPLFDASYQRVLKIFGNGKLANLPPEVQDRRFFFKNYTQAIFKYLKNASNVAITSDQLHAVLLDSQDLFFDSIGSGQYETAEYVDRSGVVAGQPPTDINVTADILNGIFNDYSFSRYLFRGEGALYRSVQCTSTVKGACAPGDQISPNLGQEENRALLTNIFGSPILASAYHDTATDTNPTGPTAFLCATADPKDATNKLDLADLPGGAGGRCQSQIPPLTVDQTTTCETSADCATASPLCYNGACADIARDDSGRPMLSGYPGAIGGKTTVLALGNSPVKIVATYDDIQSAFIQIKYHVDPYDITSAYIDPPFQVLVPWEPKQPGIGFPVALSGTRDKFINTYQMNLSGTTISANVDYDFDTSGNVVFKAVETTDFLGDVFVCQDTTSKDILTARMYTSVSAILAWFGAHPAAYNDCQMIIRYSPYNNYADYITSLKNGVRLGVTQGGGYGRIVDVVLSTPGVQ